MENTTNFGFNKPDRGDLEWDIPLNENWDLLDDALTNIDPQKLAGQPASAYLQKTNADAIYLSKEDAEEIYLPVTSGVPTGSIHALAYSGTPDGYLACNGAAVSRSTYAGLFALLGTTYGVGNGSSTFNLPDLRGEFLRGVDAGRGVDASRAIGSAQSSDVGEHTHPFSGTTGNNSGSTPMGGGALHIASHPHTHSFSGTTSGRNTPSTETRPRNIAVHYVIKH